MSWNHLNITLHQKHFPVKQQHSRHNFYIWTDIIRFDTAKIQEINTSWKLCEFCNDSEHCVGENGNKARRQLECSRSAQDLKSNRPYLELNKLMPPSILPKLSKRLWTSRKAILVSPTVLYQFKLGQSWKIMAEITTFDTIPWLRKI